MGDHWPYPPFWEVRPWLVSTTRRLTMPCWPWPLPIADRPLRPECMPPRAHCERQVSHSGRQRPQGRPRAAWGRGRVARPLQGQRGSCGRQPSLAPPTRRMWAGVGKVTSPAYTRPTHDYKDANFMPLCRNGPRQQRARGNAGLWPTCGCEVLPSAYRPQTSWLTTNLTFVSVLSFCARGTGSMAPRVSCTDNGR
jgi:hypothetical protein